MQAFHKAFIATLFFHPTNYRVGSSRRCRRRCCCLCWCLCCCLCCCLCWCLCCSLCCCLCWCMCCCLCCCLCWCLCWCLCCCLCWCLCWCFVVVVVVVVVVAQLCETHPMMTGTQMAACIPFPRLRVQRSTPVLSSRNQNITMAILADLII